MSAAAATAAAESNFLSGTHAGPRRHQPAGPRTDRHGLIEGQVANYVQLRSAGPMKIEREFANTVGGADPSWPRVGCPDITDPDTDVFAVRVQSPGPEPGSASSSRKKNGEKRKKKSKNVERVGIYFFFFSSRANSDN
jgi:hypothetical protein